MKNRIFILLFLVSFYGYAQSDHHVKDNKTATHLAHMQASRAHTFYVHNLPPPKLMQGIGQSKMIIQTKSPQTQLYFNQGLNLFQDFWDFESYRAFKEAIRQDSTAIMPYWGLIQNPGPEEDSIYKHNKTNAIKQLKKLLKTANEHENYMQKLLF